MYRAVKKLFSDLDSDNRREFLKLAKECYAESTPHGKSKPDREWLLALLSEVDPTTGYIYDNEIERKRDYLYESLLTANSSAARKKQIRRSLSYFVRMTAQYSDDITDATILKAYTDSGIKKVKWLTAHDEKVCSECRPRNGEIYRIDRIPAKHWGCRCRILPIM
jgi:SPP1 gp7 family putative phage head morphogenesis protein